MPQSSFGGRVGPVMNMRSLSVGTFVPPGPDPPGPIATRPLLSISNPGGMNGYLNAQDNVLERPLDGVRLFSSAYTANPAPLIQPYLALGKTVAYSTRPTTQNPASAASYAGLADTLGQLAADSNRDMLVIINHEPENDTPPAQFIANHTAFYEAMSPIPRLLCGPCYMLGTATSTGNQGLYRPSIDSMPMDFLGVDGYNPKNSRTFRNMFDWWMDKANTKGIPLAILEWSTHGTPSQRAAHVAQARAAWENPDGRYDGLLFVSWFDSGGGPRAGPSGWWMDTALPDGWVFVDGIAQAASPPPETVPDALTPAALRGAYDALPPRGSVGPTDPPPDPPDPLQQGAVTLGTAEYPIPATGVAYTAPAPTGRTAGAGTFADPVTTVARAAQIAGPGGTVVMRAGTYRERFWVNPSYGALTIQNYPGDVVWWEGTVEIPTASWVADGAQWRVGGQPLMAHDVTDPDIIAGVPLAAHPYQVFVDDVPQEIVATRPEATAGKFFVSEGATAATYYIGTNPSGKTVLISRLQEALTLNSNVTVRGVGFRRYSPSINSTSTPHLGACKSMEDNSRWEECHFHYHSAAALHLQQNSTTTVERCTFTANGQMGIRGWQTLYPTVNQCAFYYNDTRGYPGTGAAGGVKLDTNSHGARLTNNLCVGNGAHSLWLDIFSHYGLIANNLCVDCDSSGILYEGSAGGVIVGNIVHGSNFHGILYQNSGSGEVWNNTLINTRFPINYQIQATTWPDHRGMRARNNLILQDSPPASPVVFRGMDTGSPANGVSATSLGVSYDNNAVWRRAPTTSRFAEASVAGSQANYANRAAVVASPMNWEANGIAEDNTNPNPWANLVTYELNPGSPLEGAGTALPAGIGDILGLAPNDPRRLNPNIGAKL